MFRKILFVYMLLLSCTLVSLTSLALPTSESGQNYIDECAAQGVPIPPDWGSTKWQPNGKLTDPYIDQNKVAHAYYYESTLPKGVCIALPRVSASGVVNTFGIICQGNETSKACFWDNSNFTLNSISDSKPLSAFTGGAGLLGKKGGVCTKCHAGENAFNIIPGTALDLSSIGVNTKPNDYVEPLVHKDWPQNEKPNEIGGACNTCHNKSEVGRLPQMSTDLETGYCKIMLKRAFDRGTMPPFASTNEYDAHFDLLFAACLKPPRTAAPPKPSLNSTLTWVVSAF